MNTYAERVEPNLNKIAEWAKAGVLLKEIAAKLHIGYSTLRKYISLGEQGKEPYVALVAILKESRAVSDEAIEASLFKRACGYEWVEVTKAVNPETGEMEVVKEVTKHVPADATSMIFWLANRRPDRWQKDPKSDNRTDDSRPVIEIPARIPADE